MTRIGVIGSGQVGQTLAHGLEKHGDELVTWQLGKLVTWIYPFTNLPIYQFLFIPTVAVRRG
jgi:hypothetical protein